MTKNQSHFVSLYLIESLDNFFWSSKYENEWPKILSHCLVWALTENCGTHLNIAHWITESLLKRIETHGRFEMISFDHRMFRKIYFVWPRPRSFYSGMIFFFNKPLKLLTKTTVSFNITKTILSTRDTIQTQLNRLKNKPFLKFLVNWFVSEYPRIKDPLVPRRVQSTTLCARSTVNK